MARLVVEPRGSAAGSGRSSVVAGLAVPGDLMGPLRTAGDVTLAMIEMIKIAASLT